MFIQPKIQLYIHDVKCITSIHEDDVHVCHDNTQTNTYTQTNKNLDGTPKNVLVYIECMIITTFTGVHLAFLIKVPHYLHQA